MITVGCCGYPVRQKLYQEKFSVIEINSTFYNIPKETIAEKWQKEAPINFEFIIKASQFITHPANSPTYRRSGRLSGNLKNYGYFQDTPEVFGAMEKTLKFSRYLNCQKILLQTPTSFIPNYDNLKNLYNFFRKFKKLYYHWWQKFIFLLEVRGFQWTNQLRQKISDDLGIVPAIDPTVTAPLKCSFNYFRLHGKYSGGRIIYEHKFSETELKKVLELCQKPINYVMFNNTNRWQDCQKFLELISG